MNEIEVSSRVNQLNLHVNLCKPLPTNAGFLKLSCVCVCAAFRHTSLGRPPLKVGRGISDLIMDTLSSERSKGVSVVSAQMSTIHLFDFFLQPKKQTLYKNIYNIL